VWPSSLPSIRLSISNIVEQRDPIGQSCFKCLPSNRPGIGQLFLCGFLWDAAAILVRGFVGLFVLWASIMPIDCSVSQAGLQVLVDAILLEPERRVNSVSDVLNFLMLWGSVFCLLVGGWRIVRKLCSLHSPYLYFLYPCFLTISLLLFYLV
jgi:hypothetical protein